MQKGLIWSGSKFLRLIWSIWLYSGSYYIVTVFTFLSCLIKAANAARELVLAEDTVR